VEGVFSSSMYVSSNQMCKRSPPKAGHPLFISPLKETSRWLFSLGWKRGHRMLLSEHRTLDPWRPVLRDWPHVLLGYRVSVSNGYLQSTRRSAGPHRTRPVHTGLMRREFHKPAGSPDVSHRTLPERPVLTALKHREGCKMPLHRTLSECVRCSTLVGSSAPDSEASVRCLRTQRLKGPNMARGG